MTNPQPGHTAVTRLDLKNFRRFESVVLECEPDLTVLVSENGGGKTALLDAAAIALASLVHELRKTPPKGFDASDVRLVQATTGNMVAMTPTALSCSAVLGGKAISWSRELASVTGHTTSAGTKDVKAYAQGLMRDLQASTQEQTTPTVLPLIGYYGTGRLWSSHRATQSKTRAAKDRTLQTYAYLDALSPSSSYAQFVTWFESIVREAQNEREASVPSPHAPQAALLAVRRAVDTVLQPSGWSNLDWDFVAAEVIASHKTQGRLRVDVLSDGVRNLIALVADLAHRAVRLNPHLRGAACQESPGIVLIDEVDMHLHPSWQQKVVGLLREAFPRIQFIVTTHSPLVVSTVPARSIRVLADNGTILIPSEQTEGYDGTFALHTVFRVDTHPPVPIAKVLEHYQQMIEDGEGRSERAEELKAELVTHFGEHHPAITSAAAHQRLHDFKATNRAGAE